MLTRNSQDSLNLALSQWADSLINLNRRNSLLNAKYPNKGNLKISEVDTSRFFEKLMSGNKLTIAGAHAVSEKTSEGAAPKKSEVRATTKNGPAHFLCEKTEEETDRVLKRLQTEASREEIERGISVLYVAFGFLNWTDESGSWLSPLILAPVKILFQGKDKPRQLVLEDEDLFVNPALALKLKEFGFEMPTSEQALEASDQGLDVALGLFSGLIKNNPKWSISNFAILGTFKFQKEAMYRDLVDNSQEIKSNPLVRALGSQIGSIAHSFSFEGYDVNEIDEILTPEISDVVLDADSNQRVAIAAALDGKSFVLDGPPGTGKSQTIANIIAALIGEGKRVLFVSEKIVALEVVQKRLNKVGLGDFVFELHSNKVSRKDVAVRLGQSLDKVQVFKEKLTKADLSRAEQTRNALNEYANAVNLAREPLGKSVHEVIGIVGKSANGRSIRAELDIKNLTNQDWERYLSAGTRLLENWAPIEEGESFIWSGLLPGTDLEPIVERCLDALTKYSLIRVDASSALASLCLNYPEDSDRVLALQTLWADADAISKEFLRKNLIDFSVDAVAEELVLNVKKSQEAAALADSLNETLIPDFNYDQAFDSAFDRFIHAMSRLKRKPADLNLVSLAKLTDELNLVISESRTLLAAREQVLTLAGIRKSYPSCTLTPLGEFFDSLTSGLAKPEWIKIEAQRALPGIFNRIELLSMQILEAEKEATSFFDSRVLRLDISQIQHELRTSAKGLKAYLPRWASRRSEIKSSLLPDVPFKLGLSKLALAESWQNSRKSLDSLISESRVHLGEDDFSSFGLQDWILERRQFEGLSQFVTSVDVVGDRTTLQRVAASPDDQMMLKSHLAALKSAVKSLKDSLYKCQFIDDEVFEMDSQGETIFSSLVGQSDAIERLNQVLVPMQEFFSQRLSLENIKRLCSASFENSQALEWYQQNGAKAEEVFGAIYLAGNSDLNSIEKHRVLLKSLADYLEVEESSDVVIDALDELADLTSLSTSYNRWQDSLEELRTKFSPQRANEIADEALDAASFAQFLEDGLRNIGLVRTWNEYSEAKADLISFGLGNFVEEIHSGKISSEILLDSMNKTIADSWLNYWDDQDSNLSLHSKRDLQGLAESFRELDASLNIQSSARIGAKVAGRRPTSSIGQVGVIMREAQKKTRHIPVRDLISSTRDVVFDLKPCFMMSPLSVSQFLPSDIVFDFVIFDEASQVPPGDAINCVYRSRALIAAGDNKQLPPTSFFSSIQSEEDEGEEDFAHDFDSVLDLMKSSGNFESLTLRWHYRSKHEDLISFSNHSFYNNSLITFPSVELDSDHYGVKFFKCQGVYRRGTSRDNLLEAREVLTRIQYHLENRANLSLGVVTFSNAQRNLIESLLEEFVDKNPRFREALSGKDRENAFFVKALEQVQGDERDVILFSIGYGPDEAGKLTSNFGPVNQSGGQRRLNVAVTRARQLVEVVASFSANDLPNQETLGGKHFKMYLDYAENGPKTLAAGPSESQGEAESPFEESVLSVLRDLGYEAHTQIGAAGYRIDIAIVNPNKVGKYAIGIECDGSMYHSSKSARDRDRLRHKVITGLGWNLYHIWGTNWYSNPTSEIAKLRNAIDFAISSGEAPVKESRANQVTEIELISSPIDSSQKVPEWLKPYSIARVGAAKPRGFDVSSVEARPALEKFVKNLIDVEGPIHFSLIKERLRDAWALGRIGSNIEASLHRVIKRVAFTDASGFSSNSKDWKTAVVRQPIDGCRRGVDQISASEVTLCVFNVIGENIGLTLENVLDTVSAYFDLRKTSAFDTSVKSAVAYLLKVKEIEVRDGRHYLKGR